MSESKSAGLVVEFLRERDIACPTCLYNLRETAGDRCPECGTAIRLEVAGSTSGAFWWLASVIGCAIGGLILVLALVHLIGDVVRADPRQLALVRQGVLSSSELPRWSTAAYVVALVTATSIAFAWLLTSRRRFGRLPRIPRAIFGVLCSALPLIVLGLLWLNLQST
jgi:hypothetical protein